MRQWGHGAIRPYRRRLAEARCQELHGCSFEQYLELLDIGREMVAAGCKVSQTPTRAFFEQRRNAGRRGIEWRLPLMDWWNIWRDSGHWEQRGCHAGEYVMCRKGDIGPYAIGNVFIGPALQNLSDATKKSGLPLGVRTRKPGRYLATRQIAGKMTYLGTYDTPEEASAAYQNSLAKGRKFKAPVRESERA